MNERKMKEGKKREKSERTCEANDRANLDPRESKRASPYGVHV